MIDDTWLAEKFEAHRARLKSVAHRILGSEAEAEDMVQETWLRLSRAGAEEVENLGAWLTTVVARAALDRLRARRARHEESLEEDSIEAQPLERDSPEDEALLADSIGPALLVVLDRLAPAERVAFVLHDMFGLSFEEIAPIVERTPTAARKLASRARQRVRGPQDAPKAALGLQRKVVSAFLAASRAGDFGALLELLDPNVVLRADTFAREKSAARRAQGAPLLEPETRGAAKVAETFKGRARAAHLALLGGAVGAAVVPGGELRVVFVFAMEHGKITAIDIVGDPARLAALGVRLLQD
ncbi:MAG TPA: sigma-70 family RNA polymerase sigma factor [Hyphomicrobiaceae bacterium]